MERFSVRFIGSSNPDVDGYLPRRYRCQIEVLPTNQHLRIYCDRFVSWWETSHIRSVFIDAEKRRVVFYTSNSYYEFAVCRDTDLFDWESGFIAVPVNRNSDSVHFLDWKSRTLSVKQRYHFIIWFRFRKWNPSMRLYPSSHAVVEGTCWTASHRQVRID